MPSSPPEGTTDCIRQRLLVPFEYPVVFAWDAFQPASSILLDTLSAREPRACHRVLAVLDSGVEAAWPEIRGLIQSYFRQHAARLALVAEPVTVVGGEAAKNDMAVVDRLHALFHAEHMDRHAFVLTIGGGSVLDAVGYAAATAHRGLRIVRMPTTVLGQNDSGVGVKNGVNAFGAKNFLGTFVPPFAVINDFRFIECLPKRDRVAGMAEAVKVSLIRDAQFFEWMEANSAELAATDLSVLAVLIRRSAELHLRHIATGGDPFEQGSARPLDFGHWAAHKLEGLTGHILRHGEAVGIGLLLDSRYSLEVGLLAEPEFRRIARLLARLGLPRWDDALLEQSADGRLVLLDGIDEFREHLGGDLSITLLRGVGQSVEVHQMDKALIDKALAWLRSGADPS